MEKKQNRRLDRIVRVDINNSNGDLLGRWKARVGEKNIGKRIILVLKELFGLSTNDLREEENKEFNKELELQKGLANIK